MMENIIKIVGKYKERYHVTSKISVSSCEIKYFSMVEKKMVSVEIAKIYYNFFLGLVDLCLRYDK